MCLQLGPSCGTSARVTMPSFPLIALPHWFRVSQKDGHRSVDPSSFPVWFPLVEQALVVEEARAATEKRWSFNLLRRLRLCVLLLLQRCPRPESCKVVGPRTQWCAFLLLLCCCVDFSANPPLPSPLARRPRQPWQDRGYRRLLMKKGKEEGRKRERWGGATPMGFSIETGEFFFGPDGRRALS